MLLLSVFTFDVILVTDDTVNMVNINGIRDMQNYTSEKFVIRARLLICPTRCHTWYLRLRGAFPLKLPPAAELSGVDVHFQIIKTLEPAPPPWIAPLFSYGCPPNSSGWLISMHPYTKTLATTKMWQGESPKPSGGPLWWNLGDEPRSLQHQSGHIWSLKRDRPTLPDCTTQLNVDIGAHKCGIPPLPGLIWIRSGGTSRTFIRGRNKTPLTYPWKHMCTRSKWTM